MHDEIKDQLNRIESSTKLIEQAVFGNEQIGLTGLVSDVKDLKKERQAAAVKAATIGGIVAGSIIGIKALFGKLTGGGS
jgi:hypothetical protein